MIPVQLVPMAGAARLIEPRRQFEGSMTVRELATIVHSMLCTKGEPAPGLHIFVNGFAPSSENTLEDLFASYAVDRRELVIHYSHQLVYG